MAAVAATPPVQVHLLKPMGSGVNHPYKAAIDVNGEPSDQLVVFKSNTCEKLGPTVAKFIPPSEVRKGNRNEVVLSNILKHEFGISTVTCREAYVVTPEGTKKYGLVSDFVPGLETLEDRPVRDVKDGNAVMRASILRMWTGDWDTMHLKTGNFGLTPQGEISLDYGNAGQKGVTVLGVPRVNPPLMRAFATRENVEPTLQEITSLKDDQIRSMVSDYGQALIHDWSEADTKDLTKVLINNRDRLKQRNVVQGYYDGGFHPLLKLADKQWMDPVLNRAAELQLGWRYCKTWATQYVQSKLHPQ